MGHGRALPRARDLRPPLRRGARRLGHGDAARPRRDRGGLEGLRDERAAARRPGARLARPQARRFAGAEGGVPAPARQRRVAARVRADRGRLRLRLGCDADDRSPRGRRVRPQRQQALHHECGRREPLHRLREDRPGRRPLGHLGLPRRVRCARLRGRTARAEDGDLGLDDRRAHLRRLPHPRRELARRGRRRLQDRDADPRPLAPRRRRAGARDRAGRHRLRARVREDARDDGQADRAAPADRGQARGHGDRDRGGARAALPLRPDVRRRQSTTPS